MSHVLYQYLHVLLALGLADRRRHVVYVLGAADPMGQQPASGLFGVPRTRDLVGNDRLQVSDGHQAYWKQPSVATTLGGARSVQDAHSNDDRISRQVQLVPMARQRCGSPTSSQAATLLDSHHYRSISAL